MMPCPAAPRPEAAAASASEADRRAIFGDDDSDDDHEAGTMLHPEDDLNSSPSPSDEEASTSGPAESVAGLNGVAGLPIAPPFPPSVVHHYPGGLFDNNNTTPDAKRVRVGPPPPTAAAVMPPSSVDVSGSSSEDRHRSFASIEDSRRLFQRLWTDDDEIIILQGFYDFTSQRGTTHHAHQHDTGPFYDQILSRLQLDFSKNQLVEKLRRLKKKYRNVVSKMAVGKDFAFKNPHDQATFEISRKIWSGSVLKTSAAGYDDEEEEEDAAELLNVLAPRGGRRRGAKRSASEATVAVHPTEIAPAVVADSSGTVPVVASMLPVIPSAPPVSVIPVEVKSVHVQLSSVLTALPTMLPSVAVQVEPTSIPITTPLPPPATTVTPTTATPPPPPPPVPTHYSSTTLTPLLPTTTTPTTPTNNNNNTLEETVLSCLSPLFKELLHCAMAGPLTTAFGGGPGAGTLPISRTLMPLGFTTNIPFPKEADPDGRWKKQQIRELEVFSQRLGLVQEQIKAVVDHLRSSL